jgi:2-dehydropantoate 2-reductase
MSNAIQGSGEPKLLFIGAGAIGAAVAAWIAPRYEELYVMDTGEVQEALKRDGITIYRTDSPEASRETVRVKTIDSLAELPDADVVVLCVKNYSLPKMAEAVRDALGPRPLIVSMANGVDNQGILPEYFPRVVYGVISFNARRDRPVVVGYQKKGPILIGTPDGSLREEVALVKSILGLGCETIAPDRFEDAVHSKIVMNLTNALDTLVGQGYREVPDFALYQKLLTRTLWEGVKVVRAAGYRECRMGGMPSFFELFLGVALPGFLTRGAFKSKIKTMVMSSMTQDILLRGSGASELESLTGYIVKLARKNGAAIPYNRAIYELAREKFGEGFEPLSCREVMAAVEARRMA